MLRPWSMVTSWSTWTCYGLTWWEPHVADIFNTSLK